MAQSTQAQRERIPQVANRILVAWRNGENAVLTQELQHARCLAARPFQTLEMASTLEMERLEILSGAVEALGYGGGKESAAVRLLEHLTKAGLCEATGSDFSRCQ
jgi:hypothetical protein